MVEAAMGRIDVSFTSTIRPNASIGVGSVRTYIDLPFLYTCLAAAVPRLRGHRLLSSIAPIRTSVANLCSPSRHRALVFPQLLGIFHDYVPSVWSELCEGVQLRCSKRRVSFSALSKVCTSTEGRLIDKDC